MAQKAADVDGAFVGFNIQTNERITFVAQQRIKEAQIMSKESGPPQTVKQRNDLRQILHPRASDPRSYVIETDSPFS